MSERMLVTQALDERDFLVGKITDKIRKAVFIDTKKRNEEKVGGQRITKDEFQKEAQSAYQQIMDLIERYEKIDAAIIASNAATMISTSYGEYTVAGAIALRRRIKESAKYDKELDFESKLYHKLSEELESKLHVVETKNKQLGITAESMRLSILGKDSRTKDDRPLDVVETYVRENTTELIDPLDVQKKIEGIAEKRRKLLSELDTQIKVSNATTCIEI